MMNNFNEKTFEDVLAAYPELVEEGLTLKARQHTCYGRRMDLVFEDSFGRKLIVELKAGPIKDQHMGQILSYEGMLLSADDPSIRIMLIGNRVPPNLKKALDHHGIAWKEITFEQLRFFLQDKDPVLCGKIFTDVFHERKEIKPFPKSVQTGLSRIPSRNISKSELNQSSLESLWEQFKPHAEGLRYMRQDRERHRFCASLVSNILGLDQGITLKLNDSDGVKIYDEKGRFFFCVFPKGRMVTVAPLCLTPEDLRLMNCVFRDITGKKYAMGGLVRVDFKDYNETDLKLALELAKKSFDSTKQIDTWRIIK